MMKNRKNFNSFFKYQLNFSFSHSAFYILAIVFCIFINFNFFIRKQFFVNGTTNLLLLFSDIPYISILLIPSLCFKKNESIYDSFVPLSKEQKLLINFLVILIQYTTIILLLIPSVIVINFFGDIDFGQLFTSYLCLIFYGMTVISMCIFIQDLFNSKIAGLIISAIVLLIINNAHTVAVYVSFGKIFTSFLKQISFAWHFDAAGKGIIDTRDLIYFISITFLFLYITLVLSYRKDGLNLAKNQKIYKYSYFLLILLVLLNGQKYYKRFDFSKSKKYTLSEYSNKLLSKIDKSIKITFYKSSNLTKLYPQVRDVSDFLNTFCSKNKNISLLIKDPDFDENIQKNLEQWGINSQQIKTVDNNSTGYVNVYSTIIIEGLGKTEVIPFILSSETLEYDLDTKIKRILSGSSRFVNIVCGNGLNIENDYSYLVPWLNSQGFICNVLDIYDDSFRQELESSSGLLFVLGDSEINIDNAIAIENYILSEKGNAFFAVSPYSVDIESDWKITQNKKTNVVEIIENWGARFLPEIAADISCSRITMYSAEENQMDINQSSTYTKILNYPFWIRLMPQDNCKNGMTVFWSTPFELNGNAKPYLVTTDSAYSYEIDFNSPEKIIETNPFIMESDDISGKLKNTKIIATEIKGELTGLYNAISSKNSDIIVLSDQYFVNTLMTGYNGGEYGDYRNFNFMTNTLLKLNGEQEFAELNEKNYGDNSLYKITEPEKYIKISRRAMFVLFVIIVLVILFVAVIIKILNKNKLKKEYKKIIEMIK